MKTLFPEMDAEVASDRLAERRERAQRAREFLARHYGWERFVLNHLKAEGPAVDVNLAQAAAELCDWQDGKSHTRAFALALGTCLSMWAVGKLWRREFKGHPCGENCWRYGIKGAHKP